jgi:hypothetical protein
VVTFVGNYGVVATIDNPEGNQRFLGSFIVHKLGDAKLYVAASFRLVSIGILSSLIIIRTYFHEIEFMKT